MKAEDLIIKKLDRIQSLLQCSNVNAPLKLLSISEVLDADDSIQNIVVGTIWNTMNCSGLVRVDNCEEVRNEFKKRGWIALSKNDVKDTPYQQWQWYILSIIYRLAAQKALNYANMAHELYFGEVSLPDESAHTIVPPETIDVDDKPTKNDFNLFNVDDQFIKNDFNLFDV
jgi:hypothetical protein